MFPLQPQGDQRKLLKFFWLKIFSICHRCCWHRWQTLSCEYLREFSKKFEMILMEYSGAGGKLIHEKNQKQKISWHCPFKRCGAQDLVSHKPHKVHIYLPVEYHSTCPLVWIGTPPLPQADVPPPGIKGGYVHTGQRVRGWSSPNSDDRRKSLALSLLSGMINPSACAGSQCKNTLIGQSIWQFLKLKPNA